MDRRAFLGSLLAVAAAAGVGVVSQPAQASTLLDDLKALEAAPEGDKSAAADAPAPGATPAQYYRRRYAYRPRRAYYRPVRRRRVVCQTRVNRWGRLVRRCY